MITDIYTDNITFTIYAKSNGTTFRVSYYKALNTHSFYESSSLSLYTVFSLKSFTL